MEVSTLPPTVKGHSPVYVPPFYVMHRGEELNWYIDWNKLSATVQRNATQARTMRRNEIVVHGALPTYSTMKQGDSVSGDDHLA